MTEEQESRPIPAKDGAAESKAADNSSIEPWACFRVEGTVEVDLRVYDDHVVFRRIQSAANAPQGATVTFVVGSRQLPPLVPLRYLVDNARHLGTVRIRCDDTPTGNEWIVALKNVQREAYIDDQHRRELLQKAWEQGW